VDIVLLSAALTHPEISAALVAAGIHLDPDDWSFMDGNRRLDFDEVCQLSPRAADEIAVWAEAERLARTA
jgi:hypothetical protein